MTAGNASHALDPAASNGCFETMRAYGGRIFRLRGHLDRLYASAALLGTPLPHDRRQVAKQLAAALAASGLREAVVRVAFLPGGSVLRRGPRPAAGDPGTGSQAHIVVQALQAIPASLYRRGAAVAVIPARKFSVGSIDPQAKYSARVGSVLAVMDAQLRGVDEALFMDETSSVTESTASNFGVVSRRVVLTPPCWLGLLAGITREVLFDLAGPLRLQIRETPLTRHDVYNADEAFLLSTLKEVLPVTVVDGRRIGTGRPGPVTRRLGAAFRHLVRRELHLG